MSKQMIKTFLKLMQLIYLNKYKLRLQIKINKMKILNMMQLYQRKKNKKFKKMKFHRLIRSNQKNMIKLFQTI